MYATDIPSNRAYVELSKVNIFRRLTERKKKLFYLGKINDVLFCITPIYDTLSIFHSRRNLYFYKSRYLELKFNI